MTSAAAPGAGRAAAARRATGGSGWPWTSAGCGRTRPPARGGCTATARRGRAARIAAGGRRRPGRAVAGPLVWALLLDAARPGPHDDEARVTAAQLCEVVTRLIAAGDCARRPADPDHMDAHYSPVQLAWLLRRPARHRRGPGPRPTGCSAPRAAQGAGHPGAPARHGPALRCADPATRPGAGTDARAPSARHGPVRATAWPRVHQACTAAAGWEDWPPKGPRHRGHPDPAGRRPPAPGQRAWSRCGSGPPTPGRPDQAAVAACGSPTCAASTSSTPSGSWASSSAGTGRAPRPRRRRPLDLAPDRLPRPAPPRPAAGRGTRLPWQRPQARLPRGMTPGRVRAGFRGARQAAGTPASAAKTTRPGPGRPKGSKNKRKAPRHPVGKRPARPPPSRQASKKDKTHRLNGKVTTGK